MPRQYTNDLKQSNIGDLVLSNSGLGVTGSASEARDAIVFNRLNSAFSDWEFDGVGANLESYKGQKNTEELADKIKDSIMIALTIDGLLLESDIFIDIVPVSYTDIFIIISIQGEDLSFTFNITNGSLEVGGG